MMESLGKLEDLAHLLALGSKGLTLGLEVLVYLLLVVILIPDLLVLDQRAVVYGF